MDESAVTLEIRQNVGVVRFNRPERLNAWSADIGSAFVQQLTAAAENAAVGGVVITGNGRAFSAGADLRNPSTHAVESVEEYLNSHRSMPVFDLVSKYPKPIISAVNGFAIGIGCLVPMACDFVVASERAMFGLPQVSLGILPAYGGALRVARLAGRGNALDMVLSGRKVGGEEALRMGIVSRLLPVESLVEDAVTIMNSIAAHPPHAAWLARESLRQGLDSGMEASEQADQFRFLALSQTNDRAVRHEAWRSSRS